MRTKIICSIGPSTESDEKIRELIENGMDIARLNFSHDMHKAHAQRIKKIRFWSKKLNKKVNILCDLQGPKIRIADFPNPPKKIMEGKKYIFATNGSNKINPSDIIISDPYLHSDLKKNDIVLIDDGQIELIVEKVIDHRIYAKAITSGDLYPKKGINVPLTQTTTSSLTPKDLKDLEFILTQNPEWIALSFVQNKKDVEDLRKLISKKIKIMCKIEKASAIKNLNEIIEASDGVMVARGDLGSELPIEKLPIIQKEIIKKCNYAEKPVVIATQMLASMVDAPFPTRAESTDIANAVFDGTDAVMLSNETNVGQYPIRALKTMVKIVIAAENYAFNRQNKL